jgi:hypothetical protein
MSRPETRRIAVLGAGPVGLDAALQARRLGFKVQIYDRGEIAQAWISSLHLKLWHPFGQLASATGLESIRRDHPGHPLPKPLDLITAREFREQYLEPLTMCQELDGLFVPKAQVTSVGRIGFTRSDPVEDPKRKSAPFRLLIKGLDGERFEEADLIFDCSGLPIPRWLGDGGMPALGERTARSFFVHGFTDILGAQKDQFAGKTVMVVGSGFAAAQLVTELSTLAEQHTATWTVWLSRRPRGAPLPRNSADPSKDRERLAARANHLATRGDGNVEYHSQTQILGIHSPGQDKGFSVEALVQGKAMVWQVEKLISVAGWRPDPELAAPLHVELPLDHPADAEQLEPGYFMFGSRRIGKHGLVQLQTEYQLIRDTLRDLQQAKTLGWFGRRAA